HAGDPGLRRLSAAVAHEVGNPLVGIRTWASMLRTRFDDPEFRAQFAERVEADTRRIEDVVETLARLGALDAPAHERVDVSSMIADLLGRQRAAIRERRLVVLEELDRNQPWALGDADQLRFAFGFLLDQVLGWIPERGDLYVATRHRPAALAGRPALLVELRLRGAADGLAPSDHALAVASLDAIVRAHGGRLTVATGVAGDTSLAIELPAAAPASG
ncbi:MAG: hypothetical protein DCC71_06145, partial [Proteobacteria bacterium]